MKHSFEKGSALFIILIAVVLFAALSFAVNNMMQGGNTDMMSHERVKLHANEITLYARSLRQAAQNLKISNGCSDAEISFENENIADYEHSPPVRDACKVFHVRGGGINYQAPVTDWLDMSLTPAPALQGEWFFPGGVCAVNIGTADGNCPSDQIDNESIIVMLPYIKKQICVEINKELGIDNPSGNPPIEMGDAWTATPDKYTGVQLDGVALAQGAMAGCFEGDTGSLPGAGTYHFFQILVPR